MIDNIENPSEQCMELRYEFFFTSIDLRSLSCGGVSGRDSNGPK